MLADHPIDKMGPKFRNEKKVLLSNSSGLMMLIYHESNRPIFFFEDNFFYTQSPPIPMGIICCYPHPNGYNLLLSPSQWV